MSGESVYEAVVAVGVSLVSKAAVLGILMSAVAPAHQESHQKLINSDKRKREREPVKGERSSNGIVAAIFCVYSYAFIGAAKVRFSEGQQKSGETNNVFLAAASHLWIGAQQGDFDWLDKFMTAILCARAQLHGIVREAVVPLALYLIQEECHQNNPFTLDIFRGAREQARLLEPHTAVAVPLVLHMLCDAENQAVKPAGEVETNQCLAERQVQAFAQRMNGGFKTKKAREFQNALWYHMFTLATGQFRFAEPIMHVPKKDFTKKSIVAHIAPFAGGKIDLSGPEVSNEGDEEMLVRETPYDRPGDVIVEASDLEAHLNNMSP